MLRLGWQADDLGAAGEGVAEAIEARLRTGRLLGAAEWIAAQEVALGRSLVPAKPGPKRGGRGLVVKVILSPDPWLCADG